jgi:two-component system phosphate regulon sensor histidine kinase PhoR
MANEDGQKRRAPVAVFLILFISFLVFIAVGASSVLYSANRYWEDQLRQEITRSLIQKTRLFAERVEADRNHRIADITLQAGHDAGARATVIDGNGKVLADSEIPLRLLEHEGARPEFVTALRGETGIETRTRDPFGMPVLYVAVPVSGGAVRLAYPLADINIAGAKARNRLWLGIAISMLAALAISAVTTRIVLKREAP